MYMMRVQETYITQAYKVGAKCVLALLNVKSRMSLGVLSAAGELRAD